jgi:hypothetical protein
MYDTSSFYVSATAQQVVFRIMLMFAPLDDVADDELLDAVCGTYEDSIDGLYIKVEDSHVDMIQFCIFNVY